MAWRRALNSPLSSVRLEGDASAKRRRTVAAFVLGVAISAVGLGAVVASGASARGPFGFGGGWGGGGNYHATYSVVNVDSSATAWASHSFFGDYFGDDGRYGRSTTRVYLRSDGWDDGAPRRRRHSHSHSSNYSHAQAGVSARISAGLHEPVCVRLCDGFFFPLAGVAADASSQASACNSLCPDAPTEVFYKGGSDRIEDAMSAKGQPYTSLPVSLRYQTTADNTCSCHRDIAAYAPLSDSTLRRGDAIMTPAGFVVFKGANGAPHGPGDFTALTKSAIPSSERGALQSLERVSVSTVHPTLGQWFASQSNTPIAKAKTPEKHASSDDKIRLLTWPGGAGVD